MIENHTARHLRQLHADLDRDFLTAPISLGLRLGQPAVASPETLDLPVWAGRPEVPTTPAYVKPRRSLWQLAKDEAPGALMVTAVLVSVTYALALGFAGAL